MAHDGKGFAKIREAAFAEVDIASLVFSESFSGS
jgi:hypothetical protein